MKQRGLSDNEFSRKGFLRDVFVWLVFYSVAAFFCLDHALAAIPAGIHCSSCHTMHNSQDGGTLAFDAVLNPTATPNPNLLVYASCLGCHTGKNGDGKGYPYVFTNSADVNYGTGLNTGTGTEPNANTLAGGNFYWVENGNSSVIPAVDKDALGHNVADLVNDQDETLTAPPGWVDVGEKISSSWGKDGLTCAGTKGCHGDHTQTNEFKAVSGGHHGSDAQITGTTVAQSYRFLKGIIGYEDPDWELTVSNTKHNQYHGEARSRSEIDGGFTDKSTISYLCAQCHGNFHAGPNNMVSGTTTGSPWLRHPIDFDLSSTAVGSEYRTYNSNLDYSPIAPVASALSSPVDNTPSFAGLVTSIDFSGTKAIVTCVSCHRAHGSPHYKSMRWDYANSTGGSCTICHTSKS